MSETVIAETLKRIDLLRRQLVAEKDSAYAERNAVVAGLAALAVAQGWRAGTAMTDIPGWDAEWHGCVYLDLPTGQCSWHYHDRDADKFAFLPPYAGEWDGHDTAEKYRRIAALREWLNQPREPVVVGPVVPRTGPNVMVSGASAVSNCNGLGRYKTPSGFTPLGAMQKRGDHFFDDAGQPIKPPLEWKDATSEEILAEMAADGWVPVCAHPIS